MNLAGMSLSELESWFLSRRVDSDELFWDSGVSPFCSLSFVVPEYSWLACLSAKLFKQFRTLMGIFAPGKDMPG